MSFKVALVAIALGGAVACGEDSVLWRIGLKDNSSAEFTGKTFPSEYEIRAGWADAKTWPAFAPQVTGDADGYPASAKLNTTFKYQLQDVPSNGELFRFKAVNASSFVTEVAVFANGMPCGILQMVGTEGWLGGERKGRQFGNTYSVYIPKEFLRPGANTLRIEKLGQPYCRSNFAYLSVTPDWMELVALEKPADEPIHSRMVHIGSQLGQFAYNDKTLIADPQSWQWLGIAYSGNPIRATYWDNTQYLATRSVQYLQSARDYNMQVILDYTNCAKKSRSGKPEFADATGELDPFWKENLKKAFDQWGPLIQYYEVCNEPCMSISDNRMRDVLAVAKYAREIKPPHVKLAAPAWTYGGGSGEPKDWDASAANRMSIEQYCDVTNGHAYGNSYITRGGNFLCTIDSFGTNGVIENGFPREFINTEMGTQRKFHVDFMNLGVNEALNASQHDRIFRAHIGFCDAFLNFATFPFGDIEYRTIDGDQYRPETWTASEFQAREQFEKFAQDSRVKIFRRLALAYSTHGRPLSYVYADPTEVQDKLVYFRAVDTSSLAPLPGSGGVASKILLNFVNFSRETQSIAVRVTLPQNGIYAGLRFGPEDQYLLARSRVQIQASPQSQLRETLGPGEAVQYILEKDASLSEVAALPEAPSSLEAQGGKVGKIGYAKLAWQGAASADEIKIQRSADGTHYLQIDSVPGATHTYEDATPTGPDRGKTYWYRIVAASPAGQSAPCPPARVEIPQ